MFSAASVCFFVRTITSERLNVGRLNLAVRYTVGLRKSRPSSKVKGQCHQGQKNQKTAESPPLTMHSRACAVSRTQHATIDDTIACRPGMTGKSSGKISACCLLSQQNSSVAWWRHHAINRSPVRLSVVARLRDDCRQVVHAVVSL